MEIENMLEQSGSETDGQERLAQYSLARLGFPATLEQVAGFAATEPGRSRVRELSPLESNTRIKQRLRTVGELREIAALDGPIGFGGIPPLEGLLSRLSNKLVILEAEDLMALADIIETASIVRARLQSLDERYENLRRLAGGLRNLDHLSMRIRAALDEHGVVRSNASPGLKNIRNRIVRARSKIRACLEDVVRDDNLARVVQEDYISIRNDRLVILLKPEFKGVVNGIVHDHSRSGASVYVEPLTAVDLNNEMASLADEEREEIRKVFQELTEEARESLDELSMDYEILIELDTLQAAALYAEESNSIEPELVERGFELLKARHPLLPSQGPTAAVPMDIVMDPDTRALVISGANMGGKTVALKMAGLFPLMVRSGLMIPVAEGSKVQLFSGIMADIGDDQDVQSRVSSFSGHMNRINEILKYAREDHLVLLDELGGATDPDEGSALAMAVIDEIISRRANVVVTTHLTQLKAYAMGMDSVKSASVEFHPQTLEPTYRLLYDLPGESHAISTAQRIGLPDRVIQMSRSYLDQASGGAAQLMVRLREKLEALEEREQEVEDKSRRLESELKSMESEKESILELFRRDALETLTNAKTEIAEIQKALKTGKIKDAAQPRAILDKLETELSHELGGELNPVPESLPPGARALVKSLGRVAIVDGRAEKGKIPVRLGNVRTRVNVEDLELLGAPNEKNASKNEQVRVDIPIVAPRSEVNIIGLRVEEALPIVEKALDEALLAGLSEVTIIHGKGAGRLKKAVREHFQGVPFVRNLHPGPVDQGGAGQTVVELAL
jgi:DNA mismatch repair protein MutS2